jgi:hypothetical protein
MTKRNKLIVGAVVVLGAYYLYDRNKKMKALAESKAGAEVSTIKTGGLKPLTDPSLVKK